MNDLPALGEASKYQGLDNMKCLCLLLYGTFCDHLVFLNPDPGVHKRRVTSDQTVMALISNTGNTNQLRYTI
jgi:hypothetical protein